MKGWSPASEHQIILLMSTVLLSPKEFTRAYFTQKAPEFQHMLASASMREYETYFRILT